MDFDHFFAAIFEIVDIWSDSTSPPEYCTFLNSLLDNLGMNPSPNPSPNPNPGKSVCIRSLCGSCRAGACAGEGCDIELSVLSSTNLARSISCPAVCVLREVDLTQ